MPSKLTFPFSGEVAVSVEFSHDDFDKLEYVDSYLQLVLPKFSQAENCVGVEFSLTVELRNDLNHNMFLLYEDAIRNIAAKDFADISLKSFALQSHSFESEEELEAALEELASSIAIIQLKFGE